MNLLEPMKIQNFLWRWC